MADVWQWFVGLLQATELPQQIQDHNIEALIHNMWVMVPFGLFILWRIYRKDWRGIAIVFIIIGLWWFSGSEYMDGTVVNGKPVLAKLVPVIGVFIALVAIIAYLLFL